MNQTQPELEYERRRGEAVAEDARLDTWSALYGNGRVLLVFVAVILAVRAYAQHIPHPVLAYEVLAALFVLMLVLQDVIDRRRRRARLRAALYQRGLDRIAGKWRAFPSQGRRFADASHPYAQDLDVLGSGSLFQLVDTTRTAQGEATLAGWLLAPAKADVLAERTASVQALAPDVSARESLAIAGFDEEVSRVDETQLVEWAEGLQRLVVPAALVWAARVLPFITTSLIIGAYAGLVTPWLAVGFAVAHFALLRQTKGGTTEVGRVAEKTELMLSRLLPMLEAASALPHPTPYLKRLTDQLSGAVAATASLKRRVAVFQSRGNIIVALLSPLLLWDVHAALLLQSWQLRTGRALRGWFAALGELEALHSLGTYAYEHPADVWPELAPDGLVFDAAALGHPLLDLSKCVRNTMALDGAGTAMLVTGSNMSGKSTLLRAVGLNTVMALAGLPVRAERMRVSVLHVATAMRASDSLQEGASFFMAEVRQLKRVVDLADSGKPVLFLLDEILQGTNTRERSLGARGVIAHLLKARAMGMVSTHDLSLAQLGDAFRDRIRYTHFTDQVDGERMTFDYQLREGIVQTSNALRLMAAVGIHVEVPE